MRAIIREAEVSIEIKRSRFIGRSFLRGTSNEALDTIKNIRETERGATHHCWAFRLGREGEQARYNDDGEPQGTAGPPILEVLKKNDVTNIVLVVTRYYGGIKLGAGGLARAYGDAAKGVLERSGLKELRLMTDIETSIPYPLLGPLENFLSKEGIEVAGKTFGEFVTLRLRVPADREDDFRAFCAHLTAGKSTLTVLGRDFR